MLFSIEKRITKYKMIVPQTLRINRSLFRKSIRRLCQIGSKDPFFEKSKSENKQENIKSEKHRLTSFEEKLRRLEMNSINFEHVNQNSLSFWNFSVAIAITISSIGLLFWWLSGKAYQQRDHFTLCDSTLRKGYFHNILTASLGFQSIGQFLTYYPMLAYSTFKLSFQLKTKWMLIGFLTNTLIVSLITLIYEKFDNGFMKKGMIPKTTGSATSLFYLFLFSTINPGHRFLGMQYIPFLIFTIAFFFYEFNEYQEVYVKEISRPGHLVACLNGIIAGLLIRRIGITKG